MTELVNAVSEEQVGKNKHRAGYPERDVNYSVDAIPLRDDVCEPPRTREVKDYRSDNQCENNDR